MKNVPLVMLVWLLLCSAGLQAQVDSMARKESDARAADTLELVKEDSAGRPTERNPKQAALMSAAVPGLGQIYNRKYWKLPIVYTGLATSVFFIGYNRSQYKLFKKYYIIDTDTTDGLVSPYFEVAPPEALRQQADQFRLWMEYSYIAFAAIYVLQMVDATVDAHLYYFDVSDDLSMHVMPTMQYTAAGRPVQGITLKFTF